VSGYLPTPFGIILVREEIGHCALCEIPFYSHRDLRAHFGTIAHREQAQAAIEAEQARKKRLALIYESDDPEIEHYLQTTVRQRMREEGRMVLKKNERAGFS
jgi:hypothetical protein